MYTFYTDKQELFECKLDLEGAKLSDSKARLVLESTNYNLLFYGTIDQSGTCKIPVKKLKSLLQESDTGRVKLEVIAEDTFFEPWNDSYNVKTSKKVTVEVVSKTETKPILEQKVTVTATPSKNNDKRLTEQFLKVLQKKNINLSNIKEHTKTLQTISAFLTKKYNLSEQDKKSIVEGVINRLK